jgi:flagellin
VIINHNLSALNAWRQLEGNDGVMSKSLEKLSSGLRINRAADDAAGLAISEKMRGQIKGLNQAIRNAQDGISLIQTAEGALNETHSILQRMRELAVQSDSDTVTDADRTNIQQELSQLISEVDRIGNTTEFNTKKLLNGGAGVSVTSSNTAYAANLSGTADTQAGTVGLTAANITMATTASVVGGSASITGAGSTAAAISAASTIGINGKTYSFQATDTIQTVLDTINAESATNGVTATWSAGAGNGIKLTAAGAGSSYAVNITAAGTGALGTGAGLTTVASTKGADAVMSTTELGGSYDAAGNHITVLTGNKKGLEFDVLADQDVTLTIGTNNSLKLQIGANAGQNLGVSIGDMRAQTLGVSGISVATRAGADAAITVIDAAISKVSSERAKIGAVQNRLEHTISNLGTSAENLTAAESRIRDVDMASEMMSLTKSQILSQAGTAMLAQANSRPQTVLQLLR